MKFHRFYENYWQSAAEAETYHSGFDVAQRKKALRTALASIPAGEKILDAGCGNGEFSTFLAEIGYQVTSIDISTVATHHARKHFPQGVFGVTSLEEGMPFHDGSFSAVWSSEVLEHLFDVHAALSEINRVLAMEGLFILTTPHHGVLKNIIIAFKNFDHHYNPYLSHIRFFTQKTLTMCLERAGFTVVSFGGVGRCWPIWRSSFVVARKIALPGPPPEIEG
jgi:2-polyprenyl-6-hydroxyphenyl methylase/3-demethylubiquinone-9 3-methyltransferase